jgi:hypothetical protein
MYPEVNESGNGKSGEVACLLGTPGLKKLLDLNSGANRGLYRATNGFLYAACGEKLYYINSKWDFIEIGELKTSSGHVDFADNGKTLVIVDGPNGYWHTFSSTTTKQILSEGWLGSTTVNYIDGYFVFHDPDTGKFYCTGLNNIELNALEFAYASGSPDNIVSVLVNHREVWLFGEDSIEAWYNAGNADFPFARIQGGFLEVGCAAAFSVAKIGRTTFWLGRDKEGHGTVYAAQGFSHQRISTHAVALAIQSYDDISDAVAFTYQENDHQFYALNFPSANTTWVYDLSTNLWHERAYLSNGKLQRHRASYHQFAYNTHVVADYENGNIYALDSETYTDNGAPIKRIRTAPHISTQGNGVIHKSFELDIETGKGTTDLGQGFNPVAILDYSDDGGHTWSNERWTELGKQGDYRQRAIWRMLGKAKNRVYRVSITDPVKVAIFGAEINFKGAA